MKEYLLLKKLACFPHMRLLGLATASVSCSNLSLARAATTAVRRGVGKQDCPENPGTSRKQFGLGKSKWKRSRCSTRVVVVSSCRGSAVP